MTDAEFFDLADDPAPARGRPRGYDRGEVLAAVFSVFREKGYEAASVEDLLAAAGLSRSSFYGCFGSKRAALLAVLEGYGAASLAALRNRAAEAERPAARARLAVEALFRAEATQSGCFIGDVAGELAAHDPDISRFVRDHAARQQEFFAGLAAPLTGPAEAPSRARAVIALAMGAGLLRKSGAPITDVEGLTREAQRLLGA